MKNKNVAPVVNNDGLVKNQTIVTTLAIVLGLMLAFSIGFNVGVKVGDSKDSHHYYDQPYYYDYPPMSPPYAVPGDAPVSGGGAAEGLRLPYQPGEEEVVTGTESVE